jgi:intergrase/recombinase
MEMAYCRKMFASHLRQSGIESEIVDLLQGRVPKAVFARRYYRPKLDYR